MANSSQKKRGGSNIEHSCSILIDELQELNSHLELFDFELPLNGTVCELGCEDYSGTILVPGALTKERVLEKLLNDTGIKIRAVTPGESGHR